MDPPRLLVPGELIDWYLNNASDRLVFPVNPRALAMFASGISLRLHPDTGSEGTSRYATDTR